ncbi:hypothetical protein Tco_1264849 [Tanacetum coccineum]
MSCVTILNTIDHLGKFDGKADEGTQSNDFTDTKASDNASQARKETEPVKNYILLPLWPADPPYSQDPKSSQDDGSKPSSDDGKKVDEDSRKDSKGINQEKEDNVNNTKNVNAASINEVNVVDQWNIKGTNNPKRHCPIPTTRIHKDHPLDQVILLEVVHSATQKLEGLSKIMEDTWTKKQRSVLTDSEDQAKMKMETPRSSGANSPPNAHT